MSRFSDTILWNWVKPEIESAINITVGALHQLSELPDATDKLGECLEPLWQSQGAFYFTRLPIAAALTEALTQALKNIQQHSGDIPENLFKHVTDAALSLSTFVDRRRGDDQNDELRLLPFLHDILVVSDHFPVTEYGFDFSNRLNTIPDGQALPQNYFPEPTSLEQVGELHHQYQLQMATLDKIQSSGQPANEKIIESLRSIREVLNHLSTIFNNSPTAETFNIADYLCEALETQKHLRRPGTFSLLNAINSYINGLTHREQNTHTEKTLTLLNNQILFYMVPCSTPSQSGQQIRDKYALDGILLANPFLSELIKPESYTDRKALKAVLTSFRDEIVSARTELEQQATPSTDTATSESEPLAQQFHRFSNLCSILKYKNWSELFLTSALSLPTSGSSSIPENEVINLCEQLLKFEDFLANGIEGNIENIVETNDKSFQFETAHRVVIKDSIESMSKVILLFDQFLSDQQDQEKVELAIETLGSISGNLKMIGVAGLASLISDSRHYIAESISKTEDTTEGISHQELIVNFILYIQLHLESLLMDSSLLDSEDRPESFVNSATQSLAQLAKKVDGHQTTEQTQPETTDPVHATALDTDLIDDEILEIFAEEAEEVLETLQLHFPVWADNQDGDALAEMRRGFHTLKGSGRMVNATQIAELAWPVENMLNRLMDGTITFSGDMKQLIDSVIEVIPTLIEAFNNRLHLDDPRIENWSSNAERLSKSEPVVTLNSEADQQSDSIDEIESDAELSDNLIEASSEQIELQTVTPETTDVVHSTPLDTDLIDDEILEIFAEEAEEVLEALQLHFPVWADNQDSAALAEMRRGFHTLKGSGRMVNATQIAELAWPVEDMLNRLMDGTITFSGDMKQLIDSVIEIIPTLIEAFNNRLHIDDPRIENWSSNAERLSKGEPVVTLTSEADQQSDSVDEIESTTEPSEQPPSELPEEFATESTTAEPELSAVPTLFEIFNEECRQHLHELKQSVAEEMSESNVEIISRALHTIRGSANAVGIFGIAQIVGALEPFFYAVSNLPEKLEQQLLMLTGDSTVLIERLIEQPLEHFEAEISGFLLQLDELHEAIRTHERQHSDADQVADPEELLMSDQVARATGELLVHGMDCMSNSNLIIESWYSSTIKAPQQSELISQYEHLATLAQQASVPEIIEITTLLEIIFQQLKPETALQESSYQSLTTVQDTLFRILDNVAMGQKVTAIDPVIAELNELLETLQTTETFAEPIPQIEVGAQIVSGDEIDPETLEIFSEEARELCQNVEQAISAWLIEPQNELYPEELLRHLHTLKGGARVTGLDQFASFTHEFESFLTRIIPIPGEFEDSIKTQLLSQLEQLIESVDNLSGGIESIGLPIATPTQPEDSTIKNSELLSTPLEQTETAENVLPFAAAQAPLTDSDEAEKQIGPIEPESPSVSPEIPAQKPAKTFTRVSTDLLESLVNLAGESSISRARTEQQVGALGNTLDEMQITLERLRNQIRQVDIETQTQSLRQKSELIEAEHEGFDALEMDRYSGMQQLARSLMESTSDLLDLKESLVNKTRDAETTLLQQSRIHSELQAGLMRTRMVPFSKMVPRIRKGVRQTAAEVNKSVQITVKNGEVEIDRTILERMIPALEHMLRNAVDHGIESPETRFKKGKPETGTITLDIRRDGGDMLIEVNDDGNGVDIDQLRKKAIAQNLMRANDPMSDQEVLQFILHSGISTAESITQISGRGVGLNVVNSEIKQLGGSIHIASTAGIGTQFIIRLPFTVSVTRALMLRTAGEQFAVPLSAIEGIVRVSPYELQNYYQPDAPNFEYAGQSYQMCYMGSLLETKHKPDLDGLSAPLPVILARSGDRAYAIQVDAILGSHEIVVKPLGPLFIAVNGFSGATILGDGSVVVILDLSTLIRGYSAGDIYTEEADSKTDTATVSTETRVMVVDDSVTVRKVTSRLLRRNGMSVTLAKDGADAIEQLHDAIPDVMLLDIEMPKIDGFEVARVIRHNERWKHLPIIMISSRTGEKHREKASAIGVNRFLGKPFQEAELLQNISELTDSANNASVVGSSN